MNFLSSVFTVASLNILSQQREPTLCLFLVGGAGGALDRVFAPMTSFVRENKIQAAHPLCTWTILWQLKEKKWFLQLEFSLRSGRQKQLKRCHQEVVFQVIVVAEGLSIARADSLHHLLLKVGLGPYIESTVE